MLHWSLNVFFSLGCTKKISVSSLPPDPFSWENRIFFARRTSFIPVCCLSHSCCSLRHNVTDHWLIHVCPQLSSQLPATLTHESEMGVLHCCSTSGGYWVVSHGLKHFNIQKSIEPAYRPSLLPPLQTRNRTFFGAAFGKTIDHWKKMKI